MTNKDFGSGSNTIVMMTAEELKEFGISLINAARKELVEKEKMYTPAEFAQKWQVDKSTLWRWVKEGKLKKTVVGGKVFYKDSDLRKEV